jgi:hypothetical protein
MMQSGENGPMYAQLMHIEQEWFFGKRSPITQNPAFGAMPAPCAGFEHNPKVSFTALIFGNKAIFPD